MPNDRDAILPYLRALILLQLEALRDDTDAKPELLLDRAGIDRKEIAEMLGKNRDAVNKAITRARGGTGKERVQRAMSPETE
jgi:DNA-directed RNA polymerase specialized sigma24 family protein